MKLIDSLMKDLWKSIDIPMRDQLFKYMILNQRFLSMWAKRYQYAVNLHFVIQ